MSGFFLLRRFPGGGRQFGHPVDGPIAQLGQDVIEVLAQVNPSFSPPPFFMLL